MTIMENGTTNMSIKKQYMKTMKHDDKMIVYMKHITITTHFLKKYQKIHSDHAKVAPYTIHDMTMISKTLIDHATVVPYTTHIMIILFTTHIHNVLTKTNTDITNK